MHANVLMCCATELNVKVIQGYFQRGKVWNALTVASGPSFSVLCLILRYLQKLEK